MPTFPAAARLLPTTALPAVLLPAALLLGACSEPAELKVGETGLPPLDDTGEVDDSAPNIAASSTSVAFGELSLPDTVEPVSLELSNEGDATLHISGLSLTGSGDFVVPDLEATDVDPGESVSLELSWSPSGPGTDEAVLEVLSNDPDEARLQVLLTGTALAGEVSIGPDDRDLGEVAWGESLSEVVSIYNSGNGPVAIYDATLVVGPGWSLPELDDIDEELPMELEAGEIRTYTVTFEPEEEGTSVLEISLASDSAVETETTASFLATAPRKE